MPSLPRSTSAPNGRDQPDHEEIVDDGVAELNPEIITVADAVTQACLGRLKRVGGGPVS